MLRTIGQGGWNKPGYVQANVEAIDSYIHSFINDSTRRSVIIAVAGWLNALGRDETIGADSQLIEQYEKMAHQLGLELRSNAAKQNASPAQAANWVAWPDLKRVVRQLGKQLEKEGVLRGEGELPRHLRPLLLKYVVGCLYTMVPPRRLDYRAMEVITRSEFAALPIEKRLGKNFLVRITPKNKFEFHFGDYKTADTYGEQVLPVPGPLAKVLRCWLGYHHSGPYLLGPLPLSQVQMCRLIADTFAPSGKQVGVNLLRHSFITYHHPPGDLQERQEHAAAMAHSIELQHQYALKV